MTDQPGPLEWIRDLPPALRFVRSARRLSLREVAKQAGVPVSTLSRIERDENDFQIGTLLKVAAWIATGTTEAPCEVCGVLFARRTDRVRHMQTHPGDGSVTAIMVSREMPDA